MLGTQDDDIHVQFVRPLNNGVRDVVSHTSFHGVCWLEGERSHSRGQREVVGETAAVPVPTGTVGSTGVE
jgi:hypothetical protein